MSRTPEKMFNTFIWFLFAALWYTKFVGPNFSHPLIRVALYLAPIPLTIALLRRSFHDLSKFPGPFLWSVTRLPMFYYLCKGELPQKIAELHEKYGPVVRVAPTELNFTCEEAWASIYSKPVNKPQLKKDPTQFVRPSSGVGGLFHEADDAVHGLIRRNFSHAFAEKTTLEQERIIQSYISLFINRLQELGDNAADICNLYNCLTFDIIGDLVFGESFASLEDSTLHPWIQNIFTHVAAMIIIGMIQKFNLVYTFINAVLHKQFKEAEDKHHSFVLDRLHKRLDLDTERPDFITHVQKFLNTKTGITLPQLAETVNQFIVGGSETIGTVLSACNYLLLSNPHTLAILTSEIRSAFHSPFDITMENIKLLSSQGKLEYMYAVISEAFRLFSPTPGNLTRVTPQEGCVIAGMPVAGGILVGVDLYSAGRSESNFAMPKKFAPERWLKDAPDIYKKDKLKAVRPFSAGPRDCIGKNLANMEMHLILSRLIFEFDLELQPESANWDKDIKIWGFFAKPQLMIKFVPVVRD